MALNESVVFLSPAVGASWLLPGRPFLPDAAVSRQRGRFDDLLNCVLRHAAIFQIRNADRHSGRPDGRQRCFPAFWRERAHTGAFRLWHPPG